MEEDEKVKVMELSRKQTVIIVGATVGVVGAGALLWFMSRSVSAGPASSSSTSASCPGVDQSSGMANAGGREGAKWQQGFYKKFTTYRGVSIFKIVKVYVPVPGVGAFADIGPCKGDCGYAAVIGAKVTSVGDLETIKRWIDDACSGGETDDEVRWYEEHPTMPKPCEPWPSCRKQAQTYGAPVIRPSSVPREMPTGHERPHPEWCDCYSCGC